MHVVVVSTIADTDRFWGSLKKAHGQLPTGARWTLAVASTNGTKAVNIIVHDSIDSVRSFFEEHAGHFAATEYIRCTHKSSARRNASDTSCPR